jgi:undecaprenyl-diphosphatase
MFEAITSFDEAAFLYLHEIGHPYLDGFMWWMSNRFIWIPFYLWLIYHLYQTHGSSFYQQVLALILLITLTDQVTSSLMKPFFERLRPCHDPDLLGLIKLVGNCGGSYSFASGHAANTFGLAGFFFFFENKSRLGIFLLIWAGVISYSRVYLGVHFPGDIIIGCLIGLLISYAISTLLKKITVD